MRISAHAVSTAIRDSIVDGSFPPGARLTEELLARRYGISRVPVREALRALESEGFVVTRRHAGAFVAEPGEHERADLLDVRALLEPLGAARAAQRRTQAHLKVLSGVVRLGRGRIERGHLSDLRSLDDWFHETLAHATGSPSFAALLIQLRRKLVWLRALDGEPCAGERAGSERRSEVAWQEHAALADAVARGDAERARALAAARLERCAALLRVPAPSSRSAEQAGKTGSRGNPRQEGPGENARKTGDAGKAAVRKQKPSVNTARARA